MTDYQREYSKVPLFGVGALIVHDSRIALVRRANEPSRGQWSIPGGLVKLGEPLLDAVKREAFEETGLLVEPVFLVELLDRVFYDQSGLVQYHYILADYWCEVKDGAILAGSDASEAKWASLGDLAELGVADITVQVINKGFEFGRNASESKHRFDTKQL